MRVAVQCPDDHPVSPGAVFAFRLGRIEDGVHNHVLHTGETVPLQDFVAGLVGLAKEEFPGHTVRIERLVDSGDGTSRWVPADEFDPEQHTPAPPGGSSKSAEINVTSAQTGA